MSQYPSPIPALVTLRDSLAKAYQEAARVFAGLLRFGTAAQILTAFRASLVAERALLLDSGGAVEQAIADALDHEIAQVDRDLAESAGRRTN